ncbi:hypothetical protein BD626DRAFT_473962 [Schizophyllum amplum]|uniref:Uncharacterized protein n=1 Tax=Schizophyllum amplum TaxID=97359 RepID=A0A550CXD2_9AGAR|nr:hypothetical protein BD626DRAFT_473962 [Auriculariopsis ampla]
MTCAGCARSACDTHARRCDADERRHWSPSVRTQPRSSPAPCHDRHDHRARPCWRTAGERRMASETCDRSETFLRRSSDDHLLRRAPSGAHPPSTRQQTVSPTVVTARQ